MHLFTRAIRSRWALLSGLCLVGLAGGLGIRALASGPNAQQHEDRQAEVTRCLEIMEDVNLPVRDRIQAGLRLRDHVDFMRLHRPEAVPRLAELLPGNYDALTLEVINLLGQIGDERAVPKLREMAESDVNMHGKLNAVLMWSLETLDPPPDEPRAAED